MRGRRRERVVEFHNAGAGGDEFECGNVRQDRNVVPKGLVKRERERDGGGAATEDEERAAEI